MMFSIVVAFAMIMIMMFIYMSGNEDGRPLAGFSYFDAEDERSDNLLMTILVSVFVIAMVVILW